MTSNAKLYAGNEHMSNVLFFPGLISQKEALIAVYLSEIYHQSTGVVLINRMDCCGFFINSNSLCSFKLYG